MLYKNPLLDSPADESRRATPLADVDSSCSDLYTNSGLSTNLALDLQSLSPVDRFMDPKDSNERCEYQASSENMLDSFQPAPRMDHRSGSAGQTEAHTPGGKCIHVVEVERFY